MGHHKEEDTVKNRMNLLITGMAHAKIQLIIFY